MKKQQTFELWKKSAAIRSESEYSWLASSFVHWDLGNLYHTVVSGGRLQDRAAVELSLLKMARQCGGGKEPMPTVVIHQRNRYLEEKLTRDGKNARLSGGRLFRIEPLYGLTDREIASRLYAVAKRREEGCSANLRELLLLGCELLRAQGVQPGIESLAELPWNRLPEHLEKMLEQNRLETQTALEMIARIGELKAEQGQAAVLLENLREEYSPMSFDDEDAISLDRAVEENGVACIQLFSGSRVLRELLFYTLERITLRGRQFLLIVDSLDIPSANTFVKEVLKNRNGGYALVFSDADVPAALGTDFTYFVSGDTNIVIFAHQAGKSAETWAEYMGKSYQTKESVSYGESRTQTKLLDRQISRSRVQDEELRFRVPTECLQNLPAGEAIVQAGAAGSDLWFVHYPTLFDLQQKKRLYLREG